MQLKICRTDTWVRFLCNTLSFFLVNSLKKLRWRNFKVIKLTFKSWKRIRKYEKVREIDRIRKFNKLLKSMRRSENLVHKSKKKCSLTRDWSWNFRIARHDSLHQGPWPVRRKDRVYREHLLRRSSGKSGSNPLDRDDRWSSAPERNADRILSTGARRSLERGSTQRIPHRWTLLDCP